MPELPDLEHIVGSLSQHLPGRTVVKVVTGDPVVFRVLLPSSPAELLTHAVMKSLTRRGPFITFAFDRCDLVVNFMLAGAVRLAEAGQKALAWEKLALVLDDGRTLQFGDEKNMAKLYFCNQGQYAQIPLLCEQGVDVLSPAFTLEYFQRAIGKKRCQARVFIMDQTKISAVGNAYADEILWEARIHPKTLCSNLGPDEVIALYTAVVSTMRWGIEQVAAAAQPLETKVRAHMRVRNRPGNPCPRCGTTIRREQVLGFDTFYCPACQSDKSGASLPWTRLGDGQRS